jgi:hypothetical protein
VPTLSLQSHPLLITLLVTLILLIIAFLTRPWSDLIANRTESLLSRFANRRSLSLWILFLAVITLRVSALPLLHVPVPGIHDEYSYLLMGDTFAHGRLANPTHPMWRSFDSFHINWFPTYSSIYPPAQGLILALGQLLGRPWFGVLLSSAAMCAAIAWMLRAWMPPRWAFLGGALTAAKFGVASYWINSYWGGAAAAIGGALVLGALGRLARNATVKNAITLGFGVAILANSRPYEGMLFCIPAAAWFLWWLAKKSPPRATPTAQRAKILLPLLLVLATTAAFTGYYNWRLTGNALLMPHVLRTRTYHSSALFLWEHPSPPLHYDNPQFEDFYNNFERENYQNTWSDALRVSHEKLFRLGNTFFWWGALLLLPGLPFALRDKKMRLQVFTIALGALGVFAVTWSFPHYAAPFTCVIIALLVQSIRHLRAMRVKISRELTRTSARATPIKIVAWPLAKWLARAAVLLLFLNTATHVARRECDPLWWTCKGDVSRQVIQDRLSQTPGKHLIVVRYDPDNHNIHDEWVYNGAEIDTAKVLWARELDPAQNARLLAYFKGRQIWLVEPDTDNTELIPYSPPPSHLSPPDD